MNLGKYIVGTTKEFSHYKGEFVSNKYLKYLKNESKTIIGFIAITAFSGIELFWVPAGLLALDTAISGVPNCLKQIKFEDRIPGGLVGIIKSGISSLKK